MMDATIILVLGCFLVTQPMLCGQNVKEDDNDYIRPFADPRLIVDRYIPVPFVLNKPIGNIANHLDELGLREIDQHLPVHHCLANLLDMTYIEFHKQLYRWIWLYALEIHMIKKWLGVCRLNLEDYLVHLESDHSSDGLELWLMSIGMDTPFNVIMDDCVCSTLQDGLDFSQPIFLLASYSEFIPCEEVPDDENPVEGWLQLSRIGQHHCLPNARLGVDPSQKPQNILCTEIHQ